MHIEIGIAPTRCSSDGPTGTCHACISTLKKNAASAVRSHAAGLLSRPRAWAPSSAVAAAEA